MEEDEVAALEDEEGDKARLGEESDDGEDEGEEEEEEEEEEEFGAIERLAADGSDCFSSAANERGSKSTESGEEDAADTFARRIFICSTKGNDERQN